MGGCKREQNSPDIIVDVIKFKQWNLFYDVDETENK